MSDKVWSLGLGPMCCLFHHCPMTIYGGCPECNKQVLKNMDGNMRQTGKSTAAAMAILKKNGLTDEQIKKLFEEAEKRLYEEE